jgi:ATP-dependent protease HslVU (ClpYQ) peptidase subunit
VGWSVCCDGDVVTTVVGHHDPETQETWIGVDTRGVWDRFVFPTLAPKLVRLHGWVLGYTGDGKTYDVMTRASDDLSKNETIWDLAVAVQRVLKEADYRDIQRVEESGPPGYGQQFLAANASGIWSIGSQGTVVTPIPAWGFLAIGSGEDFAYGAVYALSLHKRSMGFDSKQLLEHALSAAAYFDAATGEPFIIERVG